MLLAMYITPPPPVTPSSRYFIARSGTIYITYVFTEALNENVFIKFTIEHTFNVFFLQHIHIFSTSDG